MSVVDELRLLDELCQDSLELPLSHVGEAPEDYGWITDAFRELRDRILAMGAVVEAAEEIERQFPGLNGTMTIGHPLWTEMQRRLAALESAQGAEQRPETGAGA